MLVSMVCQTVFSIFCFIINIRRIKIGIVNSDLCTFCLFYKKKIHPGCKITNLFLFDSERLASPRFYVEHLNTSPREQGAGPLAYLRKIKLGRSQVESTRPRWSTPEQQERLTERTAGRRRDEEERRGGVFVAPPEQLLVLWRCREGGGGGGLLQTRTQEGDSSHLQCL